LKNKREEDCYCRRIARNFIKDELATTEFISQASSTTENNIIIDELAGMTCWLTPPKMPFV
jgi:hypothetical protein